MADALFGDPHPVRWPQAGVAAVGAVWARPADVCGAHGIVLPTPTARDACRGAGWGNQPGRPLSEVVAALLPTPQGRDGSRWGGVSQDTAAQRMADGRRNLDDAVALLPTPTVADARGSRNATAGRVTVPESWQPGWTLSDVIHAGLLLPTPKAADAAGGPSPDVAREGGLDLRSLAVLLPSPRATDGVKGGPNQRGSAGDPALPAAVQPERWGVYAAAVHRHELVSGMPAPEPTTPGRGGKPRLSAALPEWMLTLPPGWITAHVGRADALRLAGNGVVWPAAAHAIRILHSMAGRHLSHSFLQVKEAHR